MQNSPPLTDKTISFKKYIPNLPLLIWMVVLTLFLGLIAGLSTHDIINQYNIGFGRALGEFALILLPSFTLAAALAQQNIVSNAAGRATALVSPVAGAGMLCPDTAYAALSPAAGRYTLDTAFGAYTGFKLLYPAGPLIVAAGLGITQEVEPTTVLLCGVLLTLPVWAAGVIWGRVFIKDERIMQSPKNLTDKNQILKAFTPFLVLAILLILGGVVGRTDIGIVDFILTPKGALIIAAIFALQQVSAEKRRECLDSAIRRTGSLLLIIGAASAFGTMLTGLVTFDNVIPQGKEEFTLISLFIMTVIFKLVQGSSMATFAAIGPIASPIVLASGANPIAAVFAICLGSFVAILPNDSYYWLVRRSALNNIQSESHVISILAGGAAMQAMIGMTFLIITVILWS